MAEQDFQGPRSPESVVDLEQVAFRAGRVLRALGRPLRVTEPCVGLGGLRRLCELSHSEHCESQAFDTEASLISYYRGLAKHMGAGSLDKMKLGSDGDILNLSVETLQPSEVFAAGPPCGPWAATGARMGTSDSRSDVMDTCVAWIIFQAWQGQLVAFVLENSRLLKGTQYLDEILSRLRFCVPFFRVEAQVHNLRTIFPHDRERLWIRGMRRDCLGPEASLPVPFTAKDLGGRVDMRTLIDSAVPPVDPASLSHRMRCNLAAYITRIEEDVLAGKAGTVAVVELDRSPLRDYGKQIVYDMIPPLRTAGPKLFLLLSEEVKNCLPWQRQRLHRFVTPEERFMFQGHSGLACRMFDNKTAALKAAGNAYHPLHLASMLCPMLEQAYIYGALPEEPTRLSTQELQELIPAVTPAALSDDPAEAEDFFNFFCQDDSEECESMIKKGNQASRALAASCVDKKRSGSSSVHGAGPASHGAGSHLKSEVKAEVKQEPKCNPVRPQQQRCWPQGSLKRGCDVVNLASPLRRVRGKSVLYTDRND
ncbi:ngoPIIM [Symbiodinium natans]|uniref:NgoPIIM protein n=1 Tax=Symbiodinium natans TaxID=878477 RepID=A0A812MSH8_9DINO|nr:ngoPIIM [Symbiodinium natans]